MKNKRTYYHLILDKSGSMTSCIEQTVDGVNQQIRRIKEVAERFPEQELITSLTLFNNHITPVWTRIMPERLREITFSDYRPSGSTALLDAIGSTTDDIQRFAGSELDADEASVVVVIITDGHENSSVKFTHDNVASLIRELELTGKWTFSYIGATLDAVDIAADFNIKPINAMHFNLNESFMMYHKLNNSIDSYLNDKQSGKISSEFLKNEEA
jgi:hypothetical protein